ncbi:MAG TPA: hypothetical protein VMS89_05760 [Methanoregulaceae archaeon]|nr:hypothetical protein [Methanoregulaceae archaeon]
MAFGEDSRCGLVCGQNPGTLSSGESKTKILPKKKPDSGRKEAGERKSKYHAELFD